MAELSVLMRPEAHVPTCPLPCNATESVGQSLQPNAYTAALFVVSVIIIIYVIYTASYSV